MSGASKLNSELAAYSPCELAEFAATVSVLLDAADNGTVGYCAIQARIQATLYKAVEKRLKAEMRAGRTATVIPFPANRK
jgi:pectin methylesterase-like acyl-CoA thioesterase